jgi:hypothetical protein
MDNEKNMANSGQQQPQQPESSDEKINPDKQPVPNSGEKNESNVSAEDIAAEQQRKEAMTERD